MTLEQAQGVRVGAAGGVVSALSFDVEDYFMVSAFEPKVPKSAWEGFESRVGRNVRRILSVLREADVRATFFTLGWIAEREPGLVREIAEAGHEVACHGHWHRLVYDQTPGEFREDVRRAKSVLEKAAGRPVEGYRAPSFSIVRGTEWALGVLREEGFLYDSSVLPAPHARGGMPGAARYPYREQGLAEFPMSTARFLGRATPFSGGGYFRLFPYWLIRQGFLQAAVDNQPSIVYLHPWEFDPEQPRLEAPFFDRFKHYVNLDKTEEKLKCLLSEFQFSTVRDVLAKTVGLPS